MKMGTRQRALSVAVATLTACGLLGTVAQPASAAGRHGLVTTCTVRHHHASGTIANRTDHVSPWVDGYTVTTYGPKGYELRKVRVTGQAFELGAGQVLATNAYRVHRAVSCRVRIRRTHRS
jgi:hypothetical protein